MYNIMIHHCMLHFEFISQSLFPFCHYIFEPLYPFYLSSASFPFGNHHTVVCINKFSVHLFLFVLFIYCSFLFYITQRCEIIWFFSLCTSLKTCLFKFLAQFLTVCFYIVDLQVFFIYSRNQTLTRYMNSKLSFIVCLNTLLIVLFDSQKFLIQMKFNLCIFSSIALLLLSNIRNHCQIWGHEDLPLWFIKSSIFQLVYLGLWSI